MCLFYKKSFFKPIILDTEGYIFGNWRVAVILINRVFTERIYLLL